MCDKHHKETIEIYLNYNDKKYRTEIDVKLMIK